MIVVRTSEIRTDPNRMSEYTMKNNILFLEERPGSGAPDFAFRAGTWNICDR